MVSYDLIRFCSSDSRYRISASHLLHRSVDCLQQISIIIDADQVRDLDLMNTTPSQALQILEELKEYL